jgi:hypothetical protein
MSCILTRREGEGGAGRGGEKRGGDRREREKKVHTSRTHYFFQPGCHPFSYEVNNGLIH